MHRSRLTALVIDCKTSDLKDATRFWSAALGRAPRVDPDSSDERYVHLDTSSDELCLLLQAVDHPSRVHLDIETDDVEAEATRLEALGARRVEKVHSWWVMEAPTGHRFCVVRPQRAGLAEDGTVWPSSGDVVES